jgi:hypothetical protein
VNENREQKLEMQEFHLPSPSCSSSSSICSSSSECSVEEGPPSPKTPPPKFIERQGPIMVSSLIETVPDFDTIKRIKPRPPMSFMTGVYKIQIFFKWFLRWRDFKTSMMRSNAEVIHSHKAKVNSREHGNRLYNLQVWKICKRHHDDPINNYRMIRNHSDIRDQNMEYTLLGYEIRGSHLHFNRQKDAKLHKTKVFKLDQQNKVGVDINEVKNEENILNNRSLDIKQKNTSGTIQDLNDTYLV